jgi:predicted DNA-binding transcriptional regulator AlpA
VNAKGHDGASTHDKEASVPKLVYTVEEFCEAHGISRGTFYNLMTAGRGPRVMKIQNRTLISLEAAKAWRRVMERGTVPTKPIRNPAGGRSKSSYIKTHPADHGERPPVT